MTNNFNSTGLFNFASLTVNNNATFTMDAASIATSTITTANIAGTGTVVYGTNGKSTNLPSFDRNFAGNLTFNCNRTQSLTSSRTIAGNLTVASGTILTLSTNVLNVNGNLSLAGTISGTAVVLTGGTVQHIISGGGSIASLTLNDSYGSALNSSLTITSSLTLTNGAFSIGANTLTLNTASISSTSGTLSGGTTSNVTFTGTGITGLPSVTNGLGTLTLSRSSTATITLGVPLSVVTLSITVSTLTLADGGNTLSVSGDISSTGTHSGAGKISLTGGSASHTISGTGKYGNLELNDANGASLSANISVNGTLTMTSGNITTGANILTIGSSTSTLGALSYTAGNIIGNCKRWFAASTVSNVLFPVGTSSNYNGVVISYPTTGPSTGGTLTAQFIASDPGTHTIAPIDDAGYSLDVYGSQGYWKIDAAGLTGGTYDMNADVNGFVGVSDITTIRIMKRASSSVDWSVSGSHTTGSGSTAKRSGMSGFSEFALGGNSAVNPLQGVNPVQLSSFTSNVTTRDVKLNWATASENNNAGFEILRSAKNDNGSWTKVGYVTGNGTKTTPTNYSFEDKNLNTGKYNYRLKQIDYNGNFEYFNLAGEIEIGVPKKFDISQNYPNPFNPTAKIDFDLPYDSKVSMKLYDISGREVMTLVNEQKSAGYYTVQMNGNNLSSGMYFYRIIAEGNGQTYISTKKAVLIK